MAFVRSKKVGGRAYYYLVESRRLGGKVVQETVAYMSTCPTIEEAYDHWVTIETARRPRFSQPMETWKGMKIYSAIERLRAKENREALEEYLPDATEEELEEQRKEAERRKQRAAKAAASPSGRRRAEEQRKKKEERDKRFERPQILEDWAMEKALATLGLSKRERDVEKIKSAHRGLAMIHHPDKGGDARTFREINDAYKLLLRVL
jgi:DnaJ family protein A protein 2